MVQSPQIKRQTLEIKSLQAPPERFPLLRRILVIPLLLLVFIYGLATALLIGLWLLLGETNYIVNVFVNTLPVPLLPAPILLVLVLLTRRWKVAIMLLAALAMLGGLYGSTLFPEGATLVLRGVEVDVLTYNVQRRNNDYASIERILREQDADIVALQEVTPQLIEYLDQNLTDLYPYQVVPGRRRMEHIQMILSRWAIDASNGQYEVMRGVVDLEDTGVELVVYSVQLTNPLSDDGEGFDDSSRAQQAEMIRTLAAEEEEPVIILGDFNMTDATDEYRNFTAIYTDVYRRTTRGFGATFPNWEYRNPTVDFLPSLIRLDYAFASRDIDTMAARVIYDGFSDHYPLWVRIRVQ
jgi:vancomycin resistance protein VanJ